MMLKREVLMGESRYDSLRFEDIDGEYSDIAAAIGMESFCKLVSLCGGQNIYVPKSDTLLRTSRDRRMREMFNGGNYREIARRFNLSERRVRAVVAAPSSEGA